MKTSFSLDDQKKFSQLTSRLSIKRNSNGRVNSKSIPQVFVYQINASDNTILNSHIIFNETSRSILARATKYAYQNFIFRGFDTISLRGELPKTKWSNFWFVLGALYVRLRHAQGSSEIDLPALISTINLSYKDKTYNDLLSFLERYEYINNKIKSILLKTLDGEIPEIEINEFLKNPNDLASNKNRLASNTFTAPVTISTVGITERFPERLAHSVMFPQQPTTVLNSEVEPDSTLDQTAREGSMPSHYFNHLDYM